MKRCLQILLVAAVLAPAVVRAKMETMAERKQRIERKYLMQRAELVQGDAVVPAEIAVGTEEILDSEKFKEPQVDLQRQEPGAARPPPRRATPRPRQDTRNWLLAEEEDPTQNDLYANPFAWDASAEDEPKKPDRLTSEQLRRDAYYSNTEEQRDSWFSPRTDSTTPGTFDTQGSSFGTTQPRGTSPYSSMDGRSLYGQRQQEEQSPSLFGTPNSPRTKSFGETSDQDSFKMSIPYQTGTTGADREDSKRQGYIPYKSPYQTQRTPQQQWGGTSPKKQEYRRQDNFQKWKEKSPQFDPLRDDAFIDDLMPKVRR